MLSYAGSWILVSRSLAWAAVIVLLETTTSTTIIVDFNSFTRVQIILPQVRLPVIEHMLVGAVTVAGVCCGHVLFLSLLGLGTVQDHVPALVLCLFLYG